MNKIYAFYVFSLLAFYVFIVFDVNSIDTAILCDGYLFHDVFKLWSMRWYHQCNINIIVSIEYKVKTKRFSYHLTMANSVFPLESYDFYLFIFFLFHRAMATCLILMFGRLGAVGGSNFVGLLLNINCELIFYFYGILILSEYSMFLCDIISIPFTIINTILLFQSIFPFDFCVYFSFQVVRFYAFSQTQIQWKNHPFQKIVQMK